MFGLERRNSRQREREREKKRKRVKNGNGEGSEEGVTEKVLNGVKGVIFLIEMKP